MLSRIHNKLGTAGLVVAVVALVAALTGAAFAANAKLSPQQKKEVKKIAKKYAGKQGPVGPQGPQGLPGVPGTPGQNGTNGTNGTNGKSVVVNTEGAGANCAQGGVNVSVEGSVTKKYVCNGQTGFTETLPTGKTMKGAWSYAYGPGQLWATDSISFNIPLASAPEFHYVSEPGVEIVIEEFAQKEVETTECLGTYENPTATPGNLFVYAFGEASQEPKEIKLGYTKGTQTKNGVSLIFQAPSSEGVGGFALGSWAVTAG
jgi:hypothetical protein